MAPRNVYSRQNDFRSDLDKFLDVKSFQLPIQIASLGGCSGYIYFSAWNTTLPKLTTEANFQLHTNRGKTCELKLSIGPHLDTKKEMKES